MKNFITSTAILLLVFLFSLIIGYYVTDRTVDVVSSSFTNDQVQFIDSFPTIDEPIVIGSILEMESSNSFIYLLDQNRSIVHQFDLNGNYVKQISSVGPGPGELQQPLSISFDSVNLYTFEQSKMQIQTFTEDGDYTDVFMFQGAYENITVLDEKIWMNNYYFLGLPNYIDMPDLNNQPIYTVYDINSGDLSAAGSYPEIMQDKDKLGTVRTAKFAGNIYTLLRRIYKLNIYDGNTAELIKTVNLKGGIFDESREAVLDDYENYQLPLMNISVNQYGIFIPAHSEDLSVYKFDFDGNLVSVIYFSDYYETEYFDRYIRHIHIIETESSNELRFFLKVYSDFPRVLIFDKKMTPLS